MPKSESESLHETLEALRGAEDAASLPGRDRLAAVQNHLVDLLSYVEGKAGYTLFNGKRKKCPMSTTITVPVLIAVIMTGQSEAQPR